MKEDDQEKNLLTPFQKQLQDKLALGLKPTVTKYTRVDGSVLTIEKQGTKETSCNLNESPGFVIDTKPDLSVSEVRPWLFISSQDPPNDLQVLIKYGITHILSLFPKFELHESVSNYIVGHYCLDVYDEVNYNFLNTFESGVRIINDTLKSYNSCCSTSSGSDSVKIPKFLVHCNAGISRAPSFVIFYLMKCEIINFEEAYEIVKKSRPLAKPNDGFIKQLKSFSKIS